MPDGDLAWVMLVGALVLGAAPHDGAGFTSGSPEPPVAATPRPPGGRLRLDSSAPRIRPLEWRASHLLADAVARSSLVASLAERLNRSDVVVYVTTSVPLSRVSTTPGGRLGFLSSAAGVVYLKIWIDLARPPSERIALLAHEMQHALEIAADTGATNISGLRRLYLGLSAGNNQTRDRSATCHFETAQAREVEARVLEELGQKVHLVASGPPR